MYRGIFHVLSILTFFKDRVVRLRFMEGALKHGYLLHYRIYLDCIKNNNNKKTKKNDFPIIFDGIIHYINEDD